ncbi:MAG: KamA family radical SAM protein [Coxiellaceae bacterium]|jgi:EF-P beta-lysylation protein EpmB|nr:KamA family radical SAM protein [Coxiellaceae bacterium]
MKFSIKSTFSHNNLREFPGFAPKGFISRINPRIVNDPLLLQILPQKCEYKNDRGFIIDPLNEKKYSPFPGLLHKYHGRVLLLVTDICAINCRFCFRRHFREKVLDWSEVFNYIEHDSSINEIILSGGDPFMLAIQDLKEIINKLSDISHVKRIRIHSRVPIVMPEKIKMAIFNVRCPLILVIHCNHPNEINSEVENTLKLIRKKNITILNQSVLLRGINDDAKVLVNLSEKLFKVGVMPYYLHIMDKVKGAAHFYVGTTKAKEIYRKMREKLPGYLIPKLVIELQGKKEYL